MCCRVVDVVGVVEVECEDGADAGVVPGVDDERHIDIIDENVAAREKAIMPPSSACLVHCF
eukprot:2167767-Amphidinium_carterae.2